ncbi:hypothetical protein CFC21_071509 [Triticum aestivum]|uniref:KIB1-4 beta-propeller domain-containing protein n=2 Tax=Triticum aestivum TaxID=4565 RepID=A0A3B6LLX1_WHEAT|nr:uncharacterized protein LOC123116138 [Triticum aestivum]KAF7065403.1 hypothetical protein CFC21_071509 [Triticum aestivum]
MVINQSEDSSLLDPTLFPLLLFDYDYYEPGGDSTDDSIDGDLEDQEDHDGSDESEKSDNDDETSEANGAFFFYSITKRLLLRKRVDHLKDHLYWTTPQGWMLMSHPDSHDTFLWNPFTHERIGLPPDEDDFLPSTRIRCLLSHRPTDPDCVVVVVNCRDTILWYCHPGANRWSSHMYDYTGGNQWFTNMQDVVAHDQIRRAAVRSMSSLTAVGGKFYAHMSDRVVRLEFLPNPTFTTIPAEEASNTGYSYTCSHSSLLESCGELFSLIMKHPTVCDHKVAQIEVQKLDLSTRAWVKVDKLDDRVFFVDSGCLGASLGAKEVGLKGNCIYFVRRQDKALYVYDMERGTTAVHDPGLDLPDDMAPEIVVPPS